MRIVLCKVLFAINETVDKLTIYDIANRTCFPIRLLKALALRHGFGTLYGRALDWNWCIGQLLRQRIRESVLCWTLTLHLVLIDCAERISSKKTLSPSQEVRSITCNNNKAKLTSFRVPICITESCFAMNCFQTLQVISLIGQNMKMIKRWYLDSVCRLIEFLSTNFPYINR